MAKNDENCLNIKTKFFVTPKPNKNSKNHLVGVCRIAKCILGKIYEKIGGYNVGDF